MVVEVAGPLAHGGRRQRMQDVDGVTRIETLTQPVRNRRPRVQPQPLCFVPGTQTLNGIRRDGRRGWDCGQEPTVGPVEP